MSDFYTFQHRVTQDFVVPCFGRDSLCDAKERNHRAFEEMVETVQANGMSRTDMHALVDYVCDRPSGILHQEIGGVVNCLAALCSEAGLDMIDCAENELKRALSNIDSIREKNKNKPKTFS